MDIDLARRRVHSARIARLGTVTENGRAHVVPCCFVLLGDVVYTAVDAKPKSTLALRRIANIVARHSACLLIDHYEEDWSSLWWVRLDGTGRLVDSEDESYAAKRALAEKYSQYRDLAIPGPVIGLDVETWRSWP
jgi:PPOX class probable F420-dependent enzyme